MICYKDRTFCGSNTKDHNCGAEITEEQLKEAEELGLPVAYSYYCVEDESEFENEQN